MNTRHQRDDNERMNGDTPMTQPLARRPLATAVTAAVFALAAGQAQAFEFTHGELTGTVDTTLSYGASWRADDPDEDNIGKAQFNPTVFMLPNAQQRAAPGRFSVNGDDGNLNYDDGDLISHAVKITQDIDLRWRNYGAFVRWSAFYDFENSDADFLSDVADEFVGSDFTLLDAYIWGDNEVGDRFLSWRLGRQVVSWGESTFIQGGINVINPVDVSKLRIAGAELKEAFLPIDQVWATIDITENLSVEGVYMFEFEQIDPDPAGTFFSTNDFATPGGQYAMLNFGLVPQPVRNPDLYQTVCQQGNFGASDTGLPPQLVGAGCQAALPRGEDRYPGESGQFGVAFRYFAPNLNDTEFGFYYLNYHSRLPLISGHAVRTSAPSSADYFVEYPDDIHLLGVSFNTTIGTWSVAGEWSYRDNEPLQIDDVEVLFAGLTPLNGLIPSEALRFKSQLGEFAPGQEIRGWERHETNQAQVTLTKLFGPNNPFRADQIVFLTEIGANYIADLPDKDVLRYNGPGTDTGGGPDVLNGDLRNPQTQTEGFADDFSWGYRAVTRFDYNNAFGTAWTMSPRLGFNHDVDGTSPGPGGNFVDGRKSVTVGVAFDLLNEWVVDLSYTDFFDGGQFNELRDRDFYSASVRYSF